MQQNVTLFDYFCSVDSSVVEYSLCNKLYESLFICTAELPHVCFFNFRSFAPLYYQAGYHLCACTVTLNTSYNVLSVLKVVLTLQSGTNIALISEVNTVSVTGIRLGACGFGMFNPNNYYFY